MFGFNMIEPIEVTDAVLTDSNLEEDTAAWDTDTTYAEGTVVDHEDHLWESLQGTNQGNEPPTGAAADDWWLDRGADNTRAMFDGAIQSQSIQADTIEVELTVPAGRRAQALFVQYVEAFSARVVVKDADDNEVMDETQNLNDNAGVTNIWRYLFYPLRRRSYALFELPNYAAATIDLTLDNTGADAKCGDCVIGGVTRLGTTQWGGEVGMIDFSVKQRDEFGRIDWVERAWADTGAFQVWVLKGDLDLVVRLLREARASRRVYVAYDGHAAEIINGVWQDWRIVLTTPTHYVLSIPLESLA